MKHVISCFPSGSIQAVQNDEMPLHGMVSGKSQMVRASDVTWDEDLKMWEAIIRDDFIHDDDKIAWSRLPTEVRGCTKPKWVFHSKSREKAINWEISYLNSSKRKGHKQYEN